MLSRVEDVEQFGVRLQLEHYFEEKEGDNEG
jgi:hypothetical protein